MTFGCGFSPLVLKIWAYRECSQQVFFEGPEKKVEINIRTQLPSLRLCGDDYWSKLVAHANAKILSKLSNDYCDAYLLSESSLFVYDHRLILITCGKTTLANAVTFFLESYNQDDIDGLIYERKNEHFPEYQESNFFDDFKTINRLLPGKAYRFGSEDSHHIYLFNQSLQNPPRSREDVTLEILMHGISPEAKELFSSHSKEQLIEKGVYTIIPDCQFDDYFFKPTGYSLNALNDNYYYTIHVTPESPVSYTSFETNYPAEERCSEIVDKLLAIFGPQSYDLFFFQAQNQTLSLRRNDDLRKNIVENLSSGYRVQFQHYDTAQPEAQAADLIQL